LHVFCQEPHWFFHGISLNHALHIPFRTLFIHSMQYIHWMWTRPHTSTSSTRCIMKCVITSKKEGGISISNMHKVVVTSFLNIGISLRFMTFPHIRQNTLLSSIITFRMFFCISPLKHKWSNCCMTTCQSCAFMLDHLPLDKCFAKDAEYLDGIFRDANRFWKLENSLLYSK
jgi:hypothetical protein